MYIYMYTLGTCDRKYENHVNTRRPKYGNHVKVKKNMIFTFVSYHCHILFTLWARSWVPKR